MKTTILLSVLALLAYKTNAQEGELKIEQNEEITELLTIYTNSATKGNYYRIQVGFGSHTKAQRIKANFEQDFPLLPCRVDFDSPTYRVRVGRFKTKLAAERKFIEIRKKYSNAMLLKPKKSTK